MQAGNALRFRTTSTVHFLGAAATNVGLRENIDPVTLADTKGGGGGLSAGGHLRSRVREIRIVSVQNLAWELELWGSSAAASANPDTEFFMAKYAFLAIDGTQATGDTLFHYYIPDWDVCYEDRDKLGLVHLRLVNRDVTGKLANAAGGVAIELTMEPTQGI